MLLFAVRRLLQAIPILFGVSLVVFGLVHIVPGNPIDMLMPPEASPEVIAQMKAAFGFDKPLYMQYLLWLLRAVQGDFGLSVFNATPVWGQLLAALENTFVLAILGAALGFSMGVLCGMVSALYHGRWPDKLFSAIATVGVSLPHYWCAIVLVLMCAVLHDWLPAQGMGDDSLPLYERLQYLVLPVVTLSLIPMGVIGRLVRATVLDILGQDFVGALSAKGLTRWPVIRHIAKNAAPPILALMGLQFGYLLGGSILVETVFNWPGSGNLLNLAIFRRDIPGAAGNDPGVGNVFRVAQSAGRYRPGSDRPAHPALSGGSGHVGHHTRHPGCRRGRTRHRCRRPGYWKSVAQRILRDKVTMVVSLLLLGILFITLGAPLVTHYDPYVGSVLTQAETDRDARALAGHR